MHWVLILFALFASLFTLSKTSLEYAHPFFLIGSRMCFAGALLLAHQFIFNRRHFKVHYEHVGAFLLLGILAIYLTNVSEIWGLQYMASAKACLIYSLSPFAAALLSYWCLKEKLNLKKWLGLCIGFLGIFPIMLNDLGQGSLGKAFFFISWPELALMTAVLSSVYGWILLKKVVQEYRYSPMLANGLSMLIGGILALTHSYFSHEPWDPIPIIEGQWGGYLECTLWMCLISNVICYNLYGHLLKKYSATFMALSGLVTPFFASLFGWYFLDEVISWHFYASMLIFSFGLIIFYQEEIQEGNFIASSEKKTLAS